MIVPMKKVSIVILEKEKLSALASLRKLGVVHLEKIEGAGERLASLKEAVANATRAEAILSEIKVPKGTTLGNAERLGSDAARQKCADVIKLTEEKKLLLDGVAADNAEIERFAKWGTVNPADFAYLAEKGVRLSMYEMPADKYNDIPDDIDTVLVNSGKHDVRFLLISHEEGRPAGLPTEAFEVTMPTLSTDELSARVASAKTRAAEIDRLLVQNTVYLPELCALKEQLLSEVEFENVYSGMEGEDEVNLSWISGYVPVDAMTPLEKSAKENGWAMLSSDIADEDDPPTKLKNNRLVSLIYPLTDFLGTVPGYREFDISGWFLLFFTIFFGMIFGDAGYGSLMLVAAIVLIARAKAQDKKLSAGFGLLTLLAISTVIWGTLTCTWFGLTMEQIPDFLKSLSVPPISNAYTSRYDGVNSLLTTAQNIQIFCFMLALVQLSVAHIKCLIRDRKSAKCVGDLGSLFMLWGMFYIVLMLIVSGEVFPLDKIVFGIPIGTVAVVLVAGGFVMSFVFSNYEGSVGKSILESCKNIISVILGVVNVFSDIVSYIRLWAVALAGSAISGTVNEMAGQFWGHAALFFVFVILLVFGHGLNIILNVLSVLVHGVRLNTLEFSSHLSMTWSGYKYEPFSETVNN